MAAKRSHNGYVAAEDPSQIPGGLTTITPVGAPDTQLRVRAGAIATVLQYVVDQYQARVEDIDLYTLGSGDDWGYNYRSIRGATRLSNHASGTAVDLNATRHPLGTDPHDNFTDAQLATMRDIIKELRGKVQCGAFYQGRKDGMHWEITGSHPQVVVLAADIAHGIIHPPVVVPPVVVPPKPPITEVSVWQVNHPPKNDTSKHVYWVQKWLNVAVPTKLKTDGYWGAKTQAALDRYRSEILHYRGDDATGPIGLASLTALRDAAKSKLTVREGR